MEIQIKQDKKAPETIEELEEIYHFPTNKGELLMIRHILIVEPTCDDQ